MLPYMVNPSQSPKGQAKRSVGKYCAMKHTLPPPVRWIVFFSWDDITHLEGLWISPVAALPQEVRRPRLILDLTWSGLNKAVNP